MPAFSDVMTLEKALPPEKMLFLHFGAEPCPEYARMIAFTIAQHPPGRPPAHPAPRSLAHRPPATA